MPKTNNTVEGWHTAFDATLDAIHPNIYEFLEAIKREQSLMEAKYEQEIAREPPTKKKKKKYEILKCGFSV